MSSAIPRQGQISHPRPNPQVKETLPLLESGNDQIQAATKDDRSQLIKVLPVVIASSLLFCSLIGIILNDVIATSESPENVFPVTSRGQQPAGQVVWEELFKDNDDNRSCPWTNAQLTWQRTAYHFQPPMYWMNAPVYYNGYYHLFYQYNPIAAVWGNISWGHAVSTDLIHWQHLPIAMKPDQPFDIYGVWSGSATILPDGNITILYTGISHEEVEVQNLAFPANLSDPLLLNWTKYGDNPVITPPPGIGIREFRDPTTAWIGSDGKWRVLIGAKTSDGIGIALTYKTNDFVNFEANENWLHDTVSGIGMWECVDFYPVNMSADSSGVENSFLDGDDIKHVLKGSFFFDGLKDYYAIGVYDSSNDSWTPDNPDFDVGIGMRVDYGKFYASKAFYDQNKGRRILWAWVAETDTEVDDAIKGWASLQTIPREVTFDNKTGSNIIQWPVEEFESLRLNNTKFDDIFLEPGTRINLNITSATQLDISAEFLVDVDSLNTTIATDVLTNCTGTHIRGALGPFGLLVLADDSLTELTPVYFYIAKGTDGVIQHWFCTDQSRSTLANGVNKEVYGGPVPILATENFNMRVLVDHSIVEAYGQGGRTTITSRIYPTQAIYDNARIFLFNNATQLNVTASIIVWDLADANISSFIL